MSQKMMRAKGAQPGRDAEKRNPMTLALAALFVCQFAVICYFNLTQMRNHLGYDSSWNLLRAALVWQEKTLISPAWSETTNLHLDTPLPLASLLYGLTGNIWLASGIGNTLMVALLLLFMWKILARLKVSMKELIRNAFGMAHKHWKTTILCVLVLAAAFLSVYYLSLALILFVVSPAMLCVVKLMEKQVLSKYIPDEEELEKERMKETASSDPDQQDKM